MSGWLLDTNVVSELERPTPNAQVIAFLAEANDSYLSVITIHELSYGVQRAPAGRRRIALSRWLAALEADYATRILPIDRDVATNAAELRAKAVGDGFTVHLADALIAGSAVKYGLAIATRNTKDFEALGVRLSNPWSG